jgi:hypothetical protein
MGTAGLEKKGKLSRRYLPKPLSWVPETLKTSGHRGLTSLEKRN